MLYRLKEAGFQAHLVGGGVRDLLLAGKPKDFDVATDATPEEVAEIFRNSRIIGRRFKLVHVRFGREIIEVATFRGAHKHSDKEDTHSSEGMILRDNIYGSIEEDAIRRDFTINALYYNIADFSVIDYANGMQDLEKRVIRFMGDPETRYREDPVRILRAIRFAAKLEFDIEENTAEPIARLAPLLDDVPAARLFEEVLKLFHSGHAEKALKYLLDFQVLQHLLPMTTDCLALNPNGIRLIEQGLRNTDARIQAEKSVTPAFLYAVLLWEAVKCKATEFEAEGHDKYAAVQMAAGYMIELQVQYVAIPRRFTSQMREIWVLQERFTGIQGKRPARLASHPRFRAAYDFLLLRAFAGEVDQSLADWWTAYQEGKELPKVQGVEKKKPSRRRCRPKKSNSKSKAPDTDNEV